MDINCLVKKIIETLCEIGNELTPPDDGYFDKEWTEKIKERLARLGKKQQYKVSGSGLNKPHWAEWLFDLTWFEYNDYWETYDNKEYEKSTLLSIPLAMESEWNKGWGAIKEDFEKLLISDAGICLMIFQAANGKKLKQLREKLQKRIKGYKASRKKTYILAGWNFDKRKFDIVQCKVTPGGKVTSSSHSCKNST